MNTEKFDIRNISGIIFDMDGVLVDSEPVITKASILGLREYGINPIEEDFLAFTGMGEDSFIGGVAKKYGLDYKIEMKKRVYEIYVKIVDKEIKVYDGILDLLENLKSLGIKIALASSADHIKVKANLKAAKIPIEIFDALVAGEDVKNKKPAPDIFISARNKLGLKSYECLVIEDAISGVKAASAAKIISIGITTAFSKKELKEAGASLVYNKTPEILELFK